MLDTIAAYSEQHRLLPEQGTIVVAVSGGADSLCLLHILHQLCGAPGKRYPDLHLHVAHLNHLLRAESHADATYISQLAESWGLPVTIGAIDVPALARAEHQSLEEAARTARYRFLREVAHGQPIAIAHHADDQVETILLHWLRGGGLTSMIGMQPRQHDLIRPLLEVSHDETVAYCQQHGLIPLEDASNTDARFLRNRIRHELLPLLTSLNPGIRATLLRNADVIHVDATWIEQQVEQLWPTVVISVQEAQITLHTSSLLALPLSLQRHLLRRVTAQLCTGQSPLELRHYLLIERFIQSRSESPHPHAHAHAHPPGYPRGVPVPWTNEPGDVASSMVRVPLAGTLAGWGVASPKTLDLPGHLRLTANLNNVRFDRLIEQESPPATIFSMVAEALILPIPGRIPISGTPWLATAELVQGTQLEAARLALSREDWPEVWRILPSTRYSVYIDGERVGSSLQVRTRRPGDRIQPLGMVHEKKVQDILVNQHIPRAARATIPLFFSSFHCLWVAGLHIDDRVRLTSQTQVILHLSIL